MLEFLKELLGWKKVSLKVYQPTAESSPAQCQTLSRSPRVSHGLHMKVVGGKIVFRQKSKIVDF